MASAVSVPAAPPAAAAPASNLRAEQKVAAAAAADSAALGATITTELKSESWPYPLRLPSFPLDFNLLRNPKLFIFHDTFGHPLVRYFWPASTAKAAASSTQEGTTTSQVRARAIVVLVHDQGTHTVFDWLKNARLMTKDTESPPPVSPEPTGLQSHLLSIERTLTSDHLSTLPPLNTGLDSSVGSDSTRTAVKDTDRLDIISAIAAEAKKLFSGPDARERADEVGLGGETEDSVAVSAEAAAAESAAAEAAAATLTAASLSFEKVPSLFPAEPLFRDLPQNPSHAVRTACYEGSWVELFNAAQFDVYAVDQLQHGLSALVERQQQRQRKRRRRHQKKGRASAADDGDIETEEDKRDTPFSFDLLAEDVCCMLEDISRYSTLPIFLLGQGTGATVAARAAELLAKKGKLGKPHLPRPATDKAAQTQENLAAAIEELCISPLTGLPDTAPTSPLLTGVRHIGKETILPVQHVVVQSRPIPLAGLVLLSPVLQLRESVALEQVITTAAAARREKRLQQRQGQKQHEAEGGLAGERRLSGESYTTEVEYSTSAGEEEDQNASTGVGSDKEKSSSWNVFSWLLGRRAENVRAKVTADQRGVRLRRRRHQHAYQHALLPSLNVEEEQELVEEKNFDALYEKSYFRDRLTIKTLLPCTQLEELRKGISLTLSEARWLLIPIERDSRQLVTAATWQEQYRRWKKTIAKRVRETCLRGGSPSQELLHQESVLSAFSEGEKFHDEDISVDLAPWLQPDTPAIADAPSAAVWQTATPEAQKARSSGIEPKQEEKEDDVQLEPDANEAETRRRRQLKRMHMAFYLKVLVVQGMTAPQEIAYQCCGCHPTHEALPAEREVDSFAEASDVKGLVSFYHSLGGKASVARRILVQHGQLPPPQRKEKSGEGIWLSRCCGRVVDEDAAAGTLAAIAAAEATQGGSLVLLDVGSEEQRMGDDPGWEDGDEADKTAEEEVGDTDVSEANGEEYAYGGSAAAEDERFGVTEGAKRSAVTTLSSRSSPTQGRTFPSWMLPPARAGNVDRHRVVAEGTTAAAVGEKWERNDPQSETALEARYYVLEEERKRLDDHLRLVKGDELSPPDGRAEEEAAAAREKLLPSAVRQASSMYKSVYERDLQRYGTVVRLPDRRVMVGQTNVTAADLCRSLLLSQCEGTGEIPSFSSASIAEEDKERAGGPRLEELKWVKEYPVSWRGCKGGVLLPYACLQAPCEINAHVRVVEKVKAPVQVVEKIYMPEATDALNATIAEIKARERQQNSGGEIGAFAGESPTGEESDLLAGESGPKLSRGAGRIARAKRRSLRLRDVQSWRRVGAIVVDGDGEQIPLERVEMLRLKFPREYVNLFLYGATCEASANSAGAAASAAAMHRRQVTMWLLPQIHHNALCQGDKENKIGKRILNDWLLPALEDLQRSEAVWQGSQVRSQLRKQRSNLDGLPPGSI